MNIFFFVLFVWMVGATSICRLVAPKGSTTLTLYLSFSADFTSHSSVIFKSSTLNFLYFSTVNLPTGRLFKCLPILGWDEVVDDRIDGRVEIEEYSSNVHQLFICLKVNFLRNPLQSKLKKKIYYKKTEITGTTERLVLVRGIGGIYIIKVRKQ